MTVRSQRARLATGMELPYVEAGSCDGAAVVFLHAYADSWRSFEGVLPFLPAWVRAVVPTQRGHGDASKPEAGYGVHDFAKDLSALLDSLKLERATLVASSSAGFTALQLALARPERVNGLVLIGVPWSLRELAASPGLQEAVAALQDPVDAVFVRDFVVGTSSDRVPAPFLEAMTSESMKVPARVWKETLEGLLAARPPDAGSIDVPTLVIWGDRDEIVPREDQERLHAVVLGSRLVVYEGAGHLVHWEQPERVARDVVSLVAELSP